MAACWGTWTGRHVLSVVTGAGAIYLLYKTITEGLNSLPGSTDPHELESPDHQGGLTVEERLSTRVRGELGKLLALLGTQQDGRSRSAILNSIARCVYLLEPEASACSLEDIRLVVSCLDDHDKETKIQALNTLKAFTTQTKFKAEIQEHFPRILDLVISSWDTDIHAAGLQVLNGLTVPPGIEPLLRRAVPSLLGFLQKDNHAAQVQILKLLVTLSRKEELLLDILNCQVQPEFLSLLNASQPGKLLYELLVLVEVLHEGCTRPRCPTKRSKRDSCSLYEVLFGEDSHLATHLLAMFVHPEEEVQLQACKVILSLQFSKPDGDITATPLSSHSFDTTWEFPFSPSNKNLC